MNVAYRVSLGLSIVLFLSYGISLLVFDGMVADFERFGLSRMRRLTGALEVLGAGGLMVGALVPPLIVISAGALTALMIFGIAARVRARDSVVGTLPALVLAVINLFIVACALGTASAS